MAADTKPRLAFLKRLPAEVCASADLPTMKDSTPTRWQNLAQKLDKLLFRWQSGCIEENVIDALPEDKLEALLTDPEDEKTGMRLRTLADRLGIQEKDFATIKAKAGSGLKTLILAAALGSPARVRHRRRNTISPTAKTWFKTVRGGRELAGKVFTLGIWPALKPAAIAILQRRPQGGRS